MRDILDDSIREEFLAFTCEHLVSVLVCKVVQPPRIQLVLRLLPQQVQAVTVKQSGESHAMYTGLAIG